MKDYFLVLAKKNPEKGMLGEIHYWKEMLLGLIEAKREINDQVENYTENILETLRDSPEAKAPMLDYLDQIDIVYKGLKEAKWNEKYMTIIENPVTKIEQGSLEECALSIGPLMNSLMATYQNSNFYKEARIVSFMDHLLSKCLEKISDKFQFSRMVSSYRVMSEFQQDYDYAKLILLKYRDGFFIEDVMKKEKTYQEGGMSTNNENLDFLNFVRPGTKYAPVRPTKMNEKQADWSEYTSALPDIQKSKTMAPKPKQALKPNLKQKAQPVKALPPMREKRTTRQIE